MPRRRIVRGLVAAVVLATCVVGVGASASVPSLVVYVADRTTSASTSFQFTFGLNWHTGGGGFLGDLGVRVAGRNVTAMTPDGMTAFGYGNNETVTSHGSTVVSGCRDVAAVTCVDAGPGSAAAGIVDYSDDGLTAGVANHWLFVATPNVKVAFTAHGWTLHRLATAARIVTDTHADDYEINALARSVSVFSTASAPGSARGSMAEAVPPCSNADVNPLREGVGTFTLDGGVSEQQQMCPGLAYGQAIGSWARGATTWRAGGHVVGMSTLFTARLLVVDMPARWSKTG